MGHEHAFPPPRLSVRCRFSQGSFAGTRRNRRDAPLAVDRRQVGNVSGSDPEAVVKFSSATAHRDPARSLAILSRSRRFICRCFRDHAYFVSIGAGPRRSWSAAEKATSIAESYGAGETGLWYRSASRLTSRQLFTWRRLVDRSVCAGNTHPGGGAGGCFTA